MGAPWLFPMLHRIVCLRLAPGELVVSFPRRHEIMKSRKLVLAAVLLFSWLCSNVARASDSNFTPLPGNPLRKQVLDALRREVYRVHGLDVVFIVRHLRVKQGWAWVHTLPQSHDAENRYEDLSALLRLQNGTWEVVELPCSEPENPECLNGPEYFITLQERYPNVPVEVFPDLARHTFSTK